MQTSSSVRTPGRAGRLHRLGARLFALPVAFALVAGTLAGLAAVAPVAAQGTPPCSFVLGFATLHDAIPQTVGNCLENQHSGANGDALQATTGGLLVWRKADNWTAFTNGYLSWVQGPFGLQSRLNTQRFWWEPNPDGLAITPTPVAGDRCHTAGLTMEQVIQAGDAGAGHQGTTFRFTNRLAVPCTMFGYPGAQLADASGNALPTNVVRGQGYLFRDPGPTQVTVPAGGSAQFRAEWVVVPTGAETTCPTSGSIRVTPPNEYAPLTIPLTITACNGGQLNVTAVTPPVSE
jgi:hypothetical protein